MAVYFFLFVFTLYLISLTLKKKKKKKGREFWLWIHFASLCLDSRRHQMPSILFGPWAGESTSYSNTEFFFNFLRMNTLKCYIILVRKCPHFLVRLNRITKHPMSRAAIGPRRLSWLTSRPSKLSFYRILRQMGGVIILSQFLLALEMPTHLSGILSRIICLVSFF